MEAVKATQGKITGVIIPPPEIRAVVDKTAAFVAKIGKSFEQRVLASEEGKTAKFNFMRPFDPYHAYYEMKIREGEEGKSGNGQSDESKSAESADSVHANKMSEENIEKAKAAAPATVATTVKASILNPIAQLAQTKPTEASPELEFSVANSHPAGLTPFDVDAIKLAAQYTAVNGREFLANLALREQRNPQFDFLKPTHMLFSYFTYLVDCYAKILHPSAALKDTIEVKCNYQTAMESAVRRWQWTRAEAERRRMENSEDSAERLAFQAIDWFDFTVVETIDFPEGELLELPGLEEAQPSSVPSVAPKAPSAPAAPAPMARPASSSYFAPNKSSSSTAEEEDDLMEVDRSASYYNNNNEEVPDEDLSDLKVVADYQHPSSLRANANTEGLMMVDPISGKAVPVSQMSEHMRIQLLDPRWREQQQRFVDKQRETGYAEGGSIADSLKNFARKRGDIFGQAATGSGPNTAAAIAELEEQERRKNEIQSQVQWDGHYGTIGNVQAVKHELAAKAPGAFQLPSSAIKTASAIGPSAVAPVVAHYTLPAPLHHANLNSTSNNLPSTNAPAYVPPPGAISLPTISISDQLLAQQQQQQLVPPPPPSLPPSAAGVSSFAAPPPPPPLAAAAAAPAPFAPPLPSSSVGVSGSNNGSSEQAHKRARVDPSEPVLMPADQFAALFGTGEISVQVQLPAVGTDASVPATWNLQGQTVTVAVKVTDSVKQLKELLSIQLGGMPANKQQLKASAAGLGFLKDANSLAELNVGDGAVLEMTLKSRGGKR